MTPKFTKGAPLTANGLNALADAASMNITGGTGVAITRLGKKIVVNKRLGQKIKRGSIYGNVWKLSADQGAVRWGFDTGDAAYSVCATANAVYTCGDRNNNWSDGGAYASVWRLSPNGKLVWGKDIGSGINSYEVHATDDAVFVHYLDGNYKISKLDPQDGAILGTITVLGASNVFRHGFGINSTQIWTWQTVSSAQGIAVYDHDLSLVYSATPPPTNFVDITYGIGVSDDLVGLGVAYSDASPLTGITNDTLTTTNTNVSPNPVTQFSVAETISGAGSPTSPVYETHSNVDCETNYVAASYYSSYGNRVTSDKRISMARLYDTGGTMLHDIWISQSNTGSAGDSGDIALDETQGLFYFAPETRAAYMEGVAMQPTAPNPYRALIAFDIDTGAVVWKWSPATEGVGGNESLLSISADRAGSVYTSTYSAQLPEMKVAD